MKTHSKLLTVCLLLLAHSVAAKKLQAAPALRYASYFVGGALSALDPEGNIYVAGSTRKANLATTPGAVRAAGSGESDVFLMKLNPDGSTILYATYLGGSQADVVESIAVDSGGNAIVAGRTFSPDFPLASAIRSELGGTMDGFVAKINPTGTALVYSTYLGGKPRFDVDPLSIDFGSIARGQTNTATLTVRNSGSAPFTFCASVSGFSFSFVGSTDSCTFGPGNWKSETKLTVPPRGQVTITVAGSPFSIGPDDGEVSFFTDERRVFAEVPVKIEGIRASGSSFSDDPNRPPTLASTQGNATQSQKSSLNKRPFFIFLGDGDDDVRSVSVDAEGNAYVTGNTESADFPELAGIEQYHTETESFVSEAFVTKIGPGGQLLYSTYLGGTGSDAGYAIAADREGSAYVAGVTTSSNFQATASIHPFPSGSAFVVKLSPGGSRTYSTLIGASIRNIAVDANGAAYVVGYGGLPEIPTPGAFQTEFKGGRDAFAAKLQPDGRSLAYFTRLAGAKDETATAVAVDSAGSAYVVGETASPDFPVQDPLQGTFGGGEGSLFAHGDAFLTQLKPDGTGAVFSTYLGGSFDDGAWSVARGTGGQIIISGNSDGNFPLTNAPAQWSSPNGGFIAVLGQGQTTREVQLWQKLTLNAPAGKAAASAFKVEFVRVIGGSELRVDAPILEIKGGEITVRVPPALFGPTDVASLPTGTDPNVRVEILRASDRQLLVREPVVLRLPQPVIVDELVVRQGVPELRTIAQYLMGTPSPNIHTFAYLGRSSESLMALRILNSDVQFPQPLRFETDDVNVFEPELGSGLLKLVGAPFHIPNLGSGNQGVQFNVSKNGAYMFAVEASANSPGPFPARYQLHLAGNVGQPRKLVNGAPEQARGTRVDTLFNTPAPRAQSLLPGGIPVARTALFKFANVASVSQFARAVLIPPAGGFKAGMRIVRAPDPASPLELTTPTARCPGCDAPAVGTVIDFTQLPDPASVTAAPSLSESVCAVIGQNDGNGISLPKTLVGGTVLSSLILDMGSGSEIVDGTGADFEVLAASGAYSVRLGNTPYEDSFSLTLGPFSGVQQIDLAASGLKSARYVWIFASPNTVIDAVRSINVLADEVTATLGPLTHQTSATVVVRRAKDSTNLLDPFLQIIAPNGDLLEENEAGFGDDLSQDRSDAALRNRTLPQDGFYRYLVKGYDKQPDEQADGTFFTRLETSGNFDTVELTISPAAEDQTPAQKSGTIFGTRQRDSFLFQAAPGSAVSVVVNGKNSPPEFDPVVELYDPEDFLIGANDNGPGRGRNAALFGVVLPATTAGGNPAPNPSTYRVVVSAVDGFSTASLLTAGKAHIRQASAGSYELKVFTGGGPVQPPPPTPPTINGFQVTTLGQVNKPGGVAVDADSNVYVIGRDSGTLSRISPSGSVSVIAELGADAGGWHGVVIDKTGNIFVSHFTANQVVRVTPAGAVKVIATGVSQPTGLAFDSNGNLYVASLDSGTIFRISASAIANSSFGSVSGIGLHSVTLTAQGNPTVYASGLSQPVALVFNSVGELFVANRGTKQVSKIPAGGGPPSVVAQLDQAPESLALDLSGDLLAGTADGKLLRVRAGGAVVTLSADLTLVAGLARNAQGTFYLADASKNAIFKAVPTTNPTPRIQATPSSLDFGIVPTGQTRDLTLTVRNTGSGDLHVSSISIPSPFSIVAGGAPAVLPPGTSREVTIRFSSAAAGSETASAIIASDDPSQPNLSVSLSAAGSASTQEIQPAQVHLYGLSLKVSRATGQANGQSYTLEIAAGSTSSPNGELYPFFGQFDPDQPIDPAYGSGFILSATEVDEPLLGDIDLDLPFSPDQAAGAVPDFFKVSRGIGPVSTLGSFFTDFDDGSVSATWQRAAGSTAGTVRLKVVSALLGELPEFSHTFEIFEYAGTLTYTPGAPVNGIVQLSREQRAGSTLAGAVTLHRLDGDPFNTLEILPGRWTNQSNALLKYDPTVIERLPSGHAYFGYLNFEDGDLTTNDADYYTYFLVIDDPNDSNSNGVPDLSDNASEPPLSRISVEREAGQVSLRWTGAARLQAADKVTGPWIDLLQATPPVRLPAANTHRFFRLARAQ